MYVDGDSEQEELSFPQSEMFEITRGEMTAHIFT